MTDKINLIYGISRVLGKRVDLPRAVKIAKAFSGEELERIYNRVSALKYAG